MVMKGRKLNQMTTKYNKYWMRFWQDDVHMVAPFLAMRGRAAGSHRESPGGPAADRRRARIAFGES